MMNSGRLQSGNPALGSWVNYGLGSVNDNMPGFVVMLDPFGWADQRREELVERVHAGELCGDDLSAQDRRSMTSLCPRGGRGRWNVSCWIRCGNRMPASGGTA